jgi:uncharacterized integral membrane protein
MPDEHRALDDVAVPAQGPVPEGSVPESALPETHEGTPQEPETAAPEAKPVQEPFPRHTRISATWVALGCFSVLLLFALLFILQNSHSVDISYLGAHGHLPLGVALLLAALCGAALVGLAGTARIMQLRAHARRRAKNQ